MAATIIRGPSLGLIGVGISVALGLVAPSSASSPPAAPRRCAPCHDDGREATRCGHECVFVVPDFLPEVSEGASSRRKLAGELSRRGVGVRSWRRVSARDAVHSADAAWSCAAVYVIHRTTADGTRVVPGGRGVHFRIGGATTSFHVIHGRPRDRDAVPLRARRWETRGGVTSICGSWRRKS